jgi:hypothetical protein
MVFPFRPAPKPADFAFRIKQALYRRNLAMVKRCVVRFLSCCVVQFYCQLLFASTSHRQSQTKDIGDTTQ